MPRPACFLALLLPLILLAGCGGDDAAPAPTRTFTDDLGRTVTLPAEIRRVVTLAPSLTETVFAAGAGHTLIGVTDADDYPPAVDTLPRFAALPLNFESIAALRPDLVLATNQVNNPRDAETLAGLGIPTVFLSFETLADALRAVRTAGTLLGTEARATTAADSLDAAVAALRARTDAIDDRPLVLFLIDDDQLFAFGPESYVHTLIALAGGRSATADFASDAPVLSEEYPLIARPEVIAGSFGENYDPATLLALHPTWALVPAVQSGRVYGFDADLFLRPGPRLVEGARQLARALHPGLFEDTP